MKLEIGVGHLYDLIKSSTILVGSLGSVVYKDNMPRKFNKSRSISRKISRSVSKQIKRSIGGLKRAVRSKSRAASTTRSRSTRRFSRNSSRKVFAFPKKKGNLFNSRKNYIPPPSPYNLPSLKQINKNWELMNLAKRFPGTIHAPYVAAMSSTTLPTGEFKTALTKKE